MLTPDDCKRMLSKIGFELGVSPRLISERMLSIEDKQDMLNDLVPYDSLIAHVRVWMEQGMLKVSDGSENAYNQFEAYTGYRCIGGIWK